MKYQNCNLFIEEQTKTFWNKQIRIIKKASANGRIRVNLISSESNSL